MEIIYGTSNLGKIENVKKILQENNVNVHLYTLKDIGFNKEIIENGTTFEENSEIKARAIQEFCTQKNIKDKIIITDDSGLCIEKLNGNPGIHSARYAGEKATQIDSINKILTEMQQYKKDEERKCTFVCVLTAILTNGEKIVARGESKGKISHEHGKLGGLTYAPIFIPDGFEQPMSNLEEKKAETAYRHRGKALKILIEEFKERNIK